jgi:flagellar basal body-associated protein FliL
MIWRLLRRCLMMSLVPSVLAALPAHAVDREKGANELIPGIAVFIDLRPITLPVIERNRVTRQVGILLTIELSEGHVKQEATEKEHELTDAFITELYRMYGARAGANRVVDEKLLKTRLQASADRVLGLGVVRAVLIRQLVEQDR